MFHAREDFRRHSYERPSAGQTLGTRVFHAAGYFTTCEQIVYFRPSLLRLTPGLREKHNFDDDTPFDQKALDAILAHCPKRGGLVRMQASAWLGGYSLGAFRYVGVRPDDPNDVIPHEDRRDLRGLRLLDAWLERHDERAGNTLDSWVADRPENRDGSPGHVIHSHLDTSECFGSQWAWDQITRRLGHSYIVDWGDIAGDFVSLGTRMRPWEAVERAKGHEIFGYFNVQDFVPDEWKNEYPNAAFSRMTERDGAWMARILARFTPDLVGALARLAEFSDPGNTTFLERVLEGRLERILERYLTRLSPITDIHMEGRDRLCGVDLAEWRGLREPGRFRYAARQIGGPWLRLERGAGGQRVRTCRT